MGAAPGGQPRPEEPVTVTAFAVVHQTRYLQTAHFTHTYQEGKKEKKSGEREIGKMEDGGKDPGFSGGGEVF